MPRGVELLAGGLAVLIALVVALILLRL